MPVYLRNDLLVVEIGEPGELYSGARFDHSGNIIQVKLKNKHTFFTTEKSAYKNTFGFGLLNEFDIEKPEYFEGTEIGGYFLKTGVGELLRENDQPYDFISVADRSECGQCLFTKH